jgi:ABC-type Fe3+/spermidine/putrescine transport system ATPase subunit
VLDEPFDGLDDASRRAAWQRVRAIAGGRKLAVVVATSHVADALAFADRVGVLGAGVVQQLAAPVELYRRPRTRLCGEFLGNANVVTGEILFAGAGDFVAQTPLGEIRGALAEPSANPSAGAPVDILIRPEALRVDEFAPDENAFAGRVIASEFRGSTGELRFQTTAGTVLRILETNPRGALAAGGVAGTYAWVAPEDVTGILL